MQLCLLNKSDVTSRQVWVPQLHKRCSYDPRVYRPRTHRWFSAASRRRWIFSLVTAGVSVMATAVLLYCSLQTLKGSTSISLTSLWKLGFGHIDPRSLIRSGPEAGQKARSPSMVLFLANLPQLLVSVLHLNYNSLFSCMLMESEWTGLTRSRKPLRVSSPVKGQRSTYFLSLPYRYSIPLMTASGLMHWLVSQSLFLGQINPNGVFSSDFAVFESPDEVLASPFWLDELTSATSHGINKPINYQFPTYSIRSWGYSCTGIVFVLSLGCFIMITLLLMGAKKYHAGMPPAGHCSAVLSAACQRLPEDEDITQQPVMWGVVSENEGVQHCALSSSKVQVPALGAHCR